MQNQNLVWLESCNINNILRKMIYFHLFVIFLIIFQYFVWFFSTFITFVVMKSQWYQLYSRGQRIISAKICFFIFFTKMLISATPMFVNIIDKDTILQVVLQLEIENTSQNPNSNLEDLHEHGVKVFKPDSVDFVNFALMMESNTKKKNYLKNEKGLHAFDPKVPTPPPNC